MQLRRPHNQVAHGGGAEADPLGGQDGKQAAGKKRHERGDEDVNLGFLADERAQLTGNDGDDQNGQGAARTAQLIACGTDCRKGKEHEGRGLERIADCDRHRGADNRSA